MTLRALLRRFGYDIARWPRETLALHLQAVFQQLGVDCVLDVGAHHGEYGRVLRGFYQGRIVSFEPVTVSFQSLEQDADPLWDVHRLALGAQDTTLEINVSRNTLFSSFRKPTGGLPDSRVERSETVQLRRLDTVFHELVPAGARVFLKLDTQGFDLEVLKGATGCLSAIVGLQSEVSMRPQYDGSPDYLEALPYMNSLGFDLTGVFPVLRDDRLRLLEVDSVLVRS